MQAGTADLVLFDQRDREAQLGCSQGAGVAAAATPEHDEIERIRAASIGRASSAVETSHAAILSALVKAAIPEGTGP